MRHDQLPTGKRGKQIKGSVDLSAYNCCGTVQIKENPISALDSIAIIFQIILIWVAWYLQSFRPELFFSSFFSLTEMSSFVESLSTTF